MYTRVVGVKLKEGVSAEDKQAFINAANGLAGIPGVESVSAGENVGPRPDGFGLMAVIHFANVEGKNAYEPHDLHKALIASLGPIRESVMLFDYEA